MRSRWQGGFAALVVTVLAGVLVFLDLTDGGMRQWWDDHAMTTDVVGGLLVLLITVLVVDQVVLLRQVKDRARTVAVQVGIMMLLAVAPVLIDAKLSRNFLEQARRLGGEMARALSVIASSPGQENSLTSGLDAALEGLKSASAPLLANLDPGMRAAVIQDDPG